MRKKTGDEQRKRITQNIPTGSKKNVPFFRVYADLLRSKQFQALTPTARMLYIDMGIESGKNIDDFVFPRREYSERYGHRTFQKAKAQLIEAGFIKEYTYFKQESHYSLSSEWTRKRPP